MEQMPWQFQGPPVRPKISVRPTGDIRDGTHQQSPRTEGLHGRLNDLLGMVDMFQDATHGNDIETFRLHLRMAGSEPT